MDLITPQQRRYIAAHPVVFWLCVGLFAAGTISLADPDTIDQTSTSLVLPDWLRITFTLGYTVGAGACVIGLMRGIARLESAGMMLLGTSFIVDYAAIVHVRPSAWLAGLFIGFLAVGCLSRGFYLSRNGYPPAVRR